MESESKDYSFSGKWSPEIKELGFTQIPNVLIVCQEHLGLTDGELVTLVQLSMYRFHDNSIVYPSIATLARLSGNGYSTIQKRLKDLEDKGFIYRTQRYYSSNLYDLEPCVINLARHIRKCDYLPKKQVEQIQDMSDVLASFLSNKEDEHLKRQNLKHIEDSVVAKLGANPNVIIAGEVNENGN